MKRWQFYGSVLTIATGFIVVPCLLLSGDEAEPADGAIAEAEQAILSFDVKAAQVLDDAAFRKYVDIELLIDAVEGHDATLMTDLALQLAHGEKMLLRRHRVGTSEDVFRLALDLAVAARDEETLDRIAKAAELWELKDLAGEVETSRKLAGESRTDDPALRVSVTETTALDFAIYGELLRAIKDAELLADSATLDEVERQMGGATTLTDDQRKYLEKALQEAREKVGNTKQANSVAETLAKLQGESRALRPLRPFRPLARPAAVRPTAVRGLGIRPSAVRPAAVRPAGLRPTAVRGLGVRPSAIR